ncbi:hypothetical protein FQA39_LY05137 [Lamprigera yunnana]|nr:hypothetical protein FQA39_LY05137 [Lamprigera yunnana]
MVVPVINDNVKQKPKKYVGNGIKINMVQNDSPIVIIGNDCRINVGTNNGRIKVIGNSCRVNVFCGNGHIAYSGNDGRINLGLDGNSENVLYMGNDGKITKGNTRVNINISKEKKKAEVVTLENSGTKTNCYNIVNKSHKQFLVTPSIYALGIPGLNLVVKPVTNVLWLTTNLSLDKEWHLELYCSTLYTH